jgi:hypothetical protein
MRYLSRGILPCIENKLINKDGTPADDGKPETTQNIAGRSFSDPDLTAAVLSDDNFKGFAKNLLRRFNQELNAVGGDLVRLKPFTIGNPAFNSSKNNTDGLGITIHGVSYVEVHLLKYEPGLRKNYFVQLQVDLYDNFGLGAEDLVIDNYLTQWYKWWDSKAFQSWYLLQHKFNHVPLRTHVQLTIGSYLNLNTIYWKH